MPAPKPKRTNTSRTGTIRSNAPSSYSGVGGGGGGGGSSSIRSAATAAPPAAPPMSINDWLNQDTTYQAQAAALAKALTDYRAQMGQQQNQYSTDYATRVNDLNINRGRSIEDQQNDFASRGQYFAGTYGKGYSDLVGDFARRQSDMDTARANFLANLSTNLNNFQDQQGVDMTSARQQAIERRAARYGV
jgi:hypothetical protein